MYLLCFLFSKVKFKIKQRNFWERQLLVKVKITGR
ncbi:hypothetical protein SLEP1_g17489 [Rubroshorea leprosula]|uniref:Uncharacterized protein n=1 Tax=Rubroshorea leprosula TaxID=152421 RepID=A0AAV5IY66_9ROSI|nr:hypothetical protein SLEP1_g17489 [Rubroshorea leprosula]